MKRLGIAIGVLLLVLGAIGCGSDDGDTTITKAEFTQQAEAICSKAAKNRETAVEARFEEIEKLGKISDSKEQQELVVTIEEAVIPALAQMSEELNELDLPDSNADEAEAMIAAFENAVSEVEDDPERFANGEKNPLEDATKLAEKQKIKPCADI